MSARPQPPVTASHVSSSGCTVEHRLKVLHAVPFFRHLSLDELRPVNERFHSHSYQPQETIYFDGSPAERLYVLAHGKVKLLRHTVAGQDVLLDILGPGEMFGSLAALGDRAYPDEALAITQVCALGIGAADFQAVLERYPSVAIAVLQVVAGRLQEAHDAISQLSAGSVEVRVAAALLKLAEKLGVDHRDGRLIEAPLSRQDLAAMTGATTESVSRVMSQFRRDGLVTSGRGWVVLRDARALAEIAEKQG